MESIDPPSKDIDNVKRLRITPEIHAVFLKFCADKGLGYSEAIDALITAHDVVTQKRISPDFGHFIAELTAFETMLAAVAKTNLLIIAELRTLEASRLGWLAAKLGEESR